jgi:diguanylate cyclase (GGDEF)-like protein
VSIAISIGVAETGRQHPTPERVVEAADAALYRAKRAGRNRLGT